MSTYLALGYDVSRYGWPTFFEIDRCEAVSDAEAIKKFKKRGVRAPIVQEAIEHENQLPFLIAEAALFARKARNKQMVTMSDQPTH